MDNGTRWIQDDVFFTISGTSYLNGVPVEASVSSATFVMVTTLTRLIGSIMVFIHSIEPLFKETFGGGGGVEVD